jgi:putative lipoprotein
MLSSLLTLAFIVTVGTGCGQGPGEPSETPVATTAQSLEPDPIGSLFAHEWQLQEFGVIGDEDPVLPDATVTLRFEPNGGLRGSSGCNRFFADYELGPDGTPSLGPFASTRMACPPEVMDQDQSFLEAMSRLSGIEVAGDQLTLFYDENEKVLVFVEVKSKPEGQR